MEKLLPYFEQELSRLRRASAEFAGRYPKLAGTLQMHGETCADPHVERLLQACAFLNARIAKSLDDNYAGFTEPLLSMLYPHHLRPMPACSIARVDYSDAKPNAISGATVLPRGTAMKAVAQGAVSCGFRTVYDATVVPVAIRAAWFEPHIQAPSTMALPAGAGAALSALGAHLVHSAFEVKERMSAVETQKINDKLEPYGISKPWRASVQSLNNIFSLSESPVVPKLLK